MRFTLEDYENSEFWQGVRWINWVYESMGINIDRQKLNELFEQMVSGEATIRETSAEFRKKLDDGPLPEASKDAVSSSLEGESRRRLEQMDRAYARQYLEAFNPTDDD